MGNQATNCEFLLEEAGITGSQRQVPSVMVFGVGGLNFRGSNYPNMKVSGSGWFSHNGSRDFILSYLDTWNFFRESKVGIGMASMVVTRSAKDLATKLLSSKSCVSCHLALKV